MQKSSENLWNVWRCFSLCESAAGRFSDCESSGIVLVNSHRHSFKWTEKRHGRILRLCRIFRGLQNPLVAPHFGGIFCILFAAVGKKYAVGDKRRKAPVGDTKGERHPPKAKRIQTRQKARFPHRKRALQQLLFSSWYGSPPGTWDR